MKELKTLSKGKKFSYSGSVATGTTVFFGDNRKVYVSREVWSSLVGKFINQKVRIGASRTNPPKGSLGDWLITNVTKQAIASYIAPILISEGFAERESEYDIKFIKR